MEVVTIEEDVFEDVKENVALNDAKAIVTVWGPEEARLVVTVWEVDVGELLGATKDSSVSIV